MNESSNDLAAAALIVAIVVPLVSLAVSVIVSVMLHIRATKRSDEANDIAMQALELERSRAKREDISFVQPILFDPARPGVLFEVLTQSPLEEVTFEFLNYAGVGGSCPLKNVGGGERWLWLRDFDQPGTLETPGPRQFYAQAKWRNTSSSEWEESGVYGASKDRHSFRALAQP